MPAINPTHPKEQESVDGLDKLFRVGVSPNDKLNEEAYEVGTQLFSYLQAYEALIMQGKGVAFPIPEQNIHIAFNALLTGMVGNEFFARHNSEVLWALKRDVVSIQISTPQNGLPKDLIYLNVLNRYAVLDLIVALVRRKDSDSLSRFTQARQQYLMKVMEVAADGVKDNGIVR